MESPENDTAVFRPSHKPRKSKNDFHITTAATNTRTEQVFHLRTRKNCPNYRDQRNEKWYYGPRADRLQSDNDVAQMLLNFAEDLDRKPAQAEDHPAAAEPAGESRRVKRRKRRRNLANFDNLPVTTHVYGIAPGKAILFLAA